MAFSVEDTINKLKQKDLVTITEINTFKEGSQRFIISILAKLFEKSGLGSTVLRSASIFNLTMMCDLPKEKLQLLKHLIVLGIVAPKRCDKAMANLKDNEAKKMQSKS